MQDPNVHEQDARRSPSWKIIAGLAAVAVLVGGGTAIWTLNSVGSRGGTPSQSTNSASNPADPSSTAIPAEKTVQAYVLEDEGTSFKLVPVPAPTTSTEPADQLKDSFNYILSKQQFDTGASTIPAGTKLLSLTVESDGVHVDLSPEFTQGGGSASMMGRLGQVVYTASSLDPSTAVWISIDGSPLDVLGGEGIMVDQPMTRAAFDKNFQL